MRRLLLLINAIVALLPAQDTSATISGVVLDSAGAGIPSIDAELRLEERPFTIFSVRTDDNGNLKFAVLPAGTYTLVLAKLGFVTLRVKSIRLAGGEQKTLPPLRLNPSTSCGGGGPALEHLDRLESAGDIGNLSGRVESDETHPVAGATVKLLCDERKVCGETKTDSNGEFIFFNLPPRDDITIKITRKWFYAWEAGGYEIRAGFDSTYQPITLNSRLRARPGLIVCE